jgi:Uma2 family endonuclease
VGAERGNLGVMARRNVAEEPEIPVVPPGEDELPSDDGEPMETPRHRSQMNLLIQSLQAAWARRRVYVGGNMFVYFSETQVKKNDFRGPDVFVVLNASKRSRKSWVAWQEGKLPEVVIELLSDRTRQIDKGEKMRIYSQLWKTPEYYLFDPWSQEFLGYRLTKGRYQRIKPDEHGDLECQWLGLKLGVRFGLHDGEQTHWLRWLTGRGKVLPSAEEVAKVAKEKAKTARGRMASAQREAKSAQRQAKSAQREAKSAQRQAVAAQRQATTAQRKLTAVQREALSARQVAEKQRKRAEAAEQRLKQLEKRLKG